MISNIGIYCITNKSNNKVYIGSSVDLKYRQCKHKSLLKTNKHFNKHLQSAWNKYGKDTFEFNILEYCYNDDIIQREDFYINKFKSKNKKHGYNIYSADRHTVSQETRDKIRKTLTGRKLTQECKDKISKSLKGIKRTDEHKRIISETQKNKSPEVLEMLRKRMLNNTLGSLRKKCNRRCK